MAAPVNALRERLRGGGATVGLWLTLASAAAAEIAGGAGFDWCLVDGEHGPNTAQTMQAQLQALAAAGCPAALRVPVNEDRVIKQALDLGVQTLVIPMVHDACAALRAARAMRYPPDGVRGLGAGIARAARWGAIADYATTANDQVMCLVQAESAAAVANIDAIAATPGVDGVFIGPSDLAADMGLTGQPGHPQVQQAVAHLIARTRAAGKVAGIMATDAAAWPGLAAQGATMIAVGAESTVMQRALATLAQQARKATTA
jgi:4-hydroxy-2-oxoheptanedioate aldolase